MASIVWTAVPSGLGDKGAGARTGHDQAALAQRLVDSGDCHRREPARFRQFADGGKLGPGREFTAGDAILDEAAKLDPEGNRKGSVQCGEQPCPESEQPAAVLGG